MCTLWQLDNTQLFLAARFTYMFYASFSRELGCLRDECDPSSCSFLLLLQPVTTNIGLKVLSLISGAESSFGNVTGLTSDVSRVGSYCMLWEESPDTAFQLQMVLTLTLGSWLFLHP